MAKLSIFIAFALISLALSVPISRDISHRDYRIPSGGQHNFSLSFFDIMREGNPGKNIFVSPLSAFNALTLAYFGSEGETMTSLHDVLNFDSDDDKFDIMHKYYQYKYRSDSDQLRSVERVYVTNEATLNKQVTGRLAKVIEAVDFSNPEARRQEINAYVEQFTDHNLKDVLRPEDVTGTNIILMNAAYFKAAWEQKFNPSETKAKMFYGTNSSNVQMMHKKGQFYSGPLHDLNADYLVLPYEHSPERKMHLAMIVFLPRTNSPGAVDEMLSGFDDLTVIDVIIDVAKSDRSQVDVELPRMSQAQTTYELDGVFEKMGVKNLYGNPLTAFSSTTDLTIDAFNQITRLDVDEEGTTASVVSTSVARRIVQTKVFHCDHPFAYVIYNDKSNEIVFTGVYRGPN